jgi:hypothetical protein
MKPFFQILVFPLPLHDIPKDTLQFPLNNMFLQETGCPEYDTPWLWEK